MWLEAITPIIPSVINIIKNAIEASKGNDEVAIGILMGVLGTTDENRTRAAIVIANTKALKEFQSQTDTPPA